MMLKREIIRIATAFCVGAIIGLAFTVNSGSSVATVFLLGIQAVSLLYSAKFCIQTVKKLYTTYWHYRIMTSWNKPSCIKIVLMGLALSLLVSLIMFIGSVFGVFRCIYCIYTAIQEDKEYL